MVIERERAQVAKERFHAESTVANLRSATQADILAHREEQENFHKQVRAAQEAHVRGGLSAWPAPARRFGPEPLHGPQARGVC